jgi:hypothetical protein
MGRSVLRPYEDSAPTPPPVFAQGCETKRVVRADCARMSFQRGCEQRESSAHTRDLRKSSIEWSFRQATKLRLFRIGAALDDLGQCLRFGVEAGEKVEIASRAEFELA